MALPTTEIKPRSGMKGKAVHIIHVFKDFLWEMGDKSEPPEALDVSDDEYEEDPADNENENENSEEKQEPVGAPDVAVEESKEQAKSLSPAGNIL
jgi:translation initiation factor 2D